MQQGLQLDNGGLVLVGVAVALLISRRVTAGVAAKQRVEAARAQHFANLKSLSRVDPPASAMPAGAAGALENDGDCVAQPSWLDRAMLLGVSGLSTVAVIAALAVAASGWVPDVFGYFGGVASAEDGDEGGGEPAGSGLLGRLGGATKWAALAVGIKVCRVYIPVVVKRCCLRADT
eukprot:SAG11_NODE_5570_length_1521_cov_1.797468_1_plen_176_part_00